MEFKDIGTKELRELNLYPLHGFKQLKICIEYGYCDIYRLNNNIERRSKRDTTIRPHYYSTRDEMRVDIPSSDYWTLEKHIVITDFDLISDDEFIDMKFSASALCKLKWLKKYLKGEVSGTYSKIEDESFQEIISSKEILKQDETIRKLNAKICELQEENRSLKDIIDKNKKIVSNAEKLKAKYEKLLLELEKILEKVKKIKNINE